MFHVKHRPPLHTPLHTLLSTPPFLPLITLPTAPQGARARGPGPDARGHTMGGAGAGSSWAPFSPPRYWGPEG